MRKWGFSVVLALASSWAVTVLVSLYAGVPGTFPAALGYMPPLINAAPILFAVAWILIRGVKRLARSWEWGAALGLVVAAVWMCDVVWKQPLPGDRAVRVMTHNVNNESRDIPHILEVIRREKPDVVMLQEVAGEGNDPASYLAKNLNGWHMVRKGETAILSHWPLSNVVTTPSRALKGRYMISALVGAPRQFTAATVHWMVPQWRKGQSALEITMDAQRLDYDDTTGALAKIEGPVIIGGDFNNPPTHEFTRQLSSDLDNAFSQCGNGPGWTFPRRAALVRIDHLYSRGELKPIMSWVGAPAGSDHRSLFADYAWIARR